MRRSLVVVLVMAAVVALGAACDVGPAYGFVVDLATDLPDADPGDGTCSVAPPDSGCTLRAAIDESNALGAATIGPAAIVTIELATDVAISLPFANEDANGSGDLDITGSLSIVGNGHTVDANSLDRAFDVRAGTTVLRGLRIVEGLSADSGGAVRTAPNTVLSLIDSTLFGNATSGVGACQSPTVGSPICTSVAMFGGAGLFVQGTATVLSSTFQSNTSIPWVSFCIPQGVGQLCPVTWGAAILATGPLYVGNSTFTMNVNQGPHPDWAGGTAIYAPGGARVVSSTVADNGLNPATAVVGASVQHSIVTSWMCAAPLVDADGNLRSPVPCGSPGPDWLGLLADNGGPTQTMMPVAGGPAVDALAVGDCLSYAVDQRGEPRAVDQPCDIGAVERQPDDL